MLEFDNLLCLVTDHADSPCRGCVESCYVDAFAFDGSKIAFDSTICTACAACVGVCPTEAISSDDFDPNRFAISFDGKTLSCKENAPCLAVFAADQLVVMAINGEFACYLGDCKSCEINRTNALLEMIGSRIDEANNLLDQIGFATIAKSYETPNLRRGFFKKLISGAKSLNQPQKLTRTEFYATPTPKRKIVLQNRLKSLSTDQLYALDSKLTPSKVINDNCNACSKCVRICPTKALFWQEADLVINCSRCVDCALCEMVCEPNAISSKPQAYDYAHAQTTLLKRFEFALCDKCSMPFPSTNSTQTCSNCADFYDEFADMFTPEWKNI